MRQGCLGAAGRLQRRCFRLCENLSRRSGSELPPRGTAIPKWPQQAALSAAKKVSSNGKRSLHPTLRQRGISERQMCVEKSHEICE